MRCKCCNKQMRKYEASKLKWDGVQEDMCTRCIFASTDFTVEVKHEHIDVEEGMTEQKFSDY